LSYGFVPIQGEPFAWRAALAAPTYIRPGSTRSRIPHAHCEGAGSKAGWDLSPLRHLSAQSSTGHTSNLGSHKLLLSVFGLRSSPFEDGTFRHHASFKITPERHEELACQRHDGDTADAAFRGTDTRPEPDAQIAVGLIAQP
jgi:hypothetical protein